MAWLHELFSLSPEIALFLALAGGTWLGRFKLGAFQLGGVAGALVVAVLISQVGVSIGDGIKNVLFALFIYAVGFDSGPKFFSSLGRQTLREVALSLVLAVSGLLTLVVMAKLFSLDQGTAAGIAAGALTQSAIIGTAGAAIAKLDLAPAQIQQLQGNVAVGYAVTYIFGSLGTIIICVNILPKIMRRSIQEDAMKAELDLLKGAPLLAADQTPALPGIVGRLYEAGPAKNIHVSELEALASPQFPVTLERLKRGGEEIHVTPDLLLMENDVLLLVGRRQGIVALAKHLGKEVLTEHGPSMVMTTSEALVVNPAFINKRLAELRTQVASDVRHGIYVISIKRGENMLPLSDDTVIKHNDVITLYGSEQDIQRAISLVGASLVKSIKTDLLFHCLGIAVGLLIGLLIVRIGSVPLTLGSGGGALLSGLLFGWYQSRKPLSGNIPSGASSILRDLGLAGFVAVVGLQSGLQAVETIRSSGISIFLIGVVVTVVPLMITLFIGRYLLRYDNAAIFAGALSGTRSANPAFGEVLNKAGNAIPTAPFAVTYGLANVFLTLLGPLIVAIA
ncbi:aspartate-alanine antiporter [Xenorhabdus sp. PB61.4]|uniref:aspartate-alanine antiporter n=1 Tax=Xenorhabdus sp. PB61.4 TaxID=2788940 RepID=UPI001E4B9293|nr:aspartate-alanine antiporter [Xenorhabdus sp. PB61.4]MCC8368197.1 aspartate-alanine antiporter [Xenorhabdus sp. PB61.4]